MEYYLLLATAVYFGLNGWIIGYSRMTADSPKRIGTLAAFVFFGMPITLGAIVGVLAWRVVKKPALRVWFWYLSRFTDRFKDMPEERIAFNEKYFKNASGWQYLKRKYGYTQ